MDSGSRQVRWLTLTNNAIILVVVAYFALLLIPKFAEPRTHWDFTVFYTAAEAYRAGISPYDHDLVHATFNPRNPYHLYFYPPVALLFFLPFTLFSFATAMNLWIGAKIAILIGLYVLWRREFLDNDGSALLPIFIVVGFNAAALVDFETGNVTWIEQGLVWLALVFYLRKQWGWFIAGVVLAASFKLTLAALLVLLFFAGDGQRWRNFIVGCLAFFGWIVGGSLVLGPNLLGDFVTNLVVVGVPDLALTHTLWYLVNYVVSQLPLPADKAMVVPVVQGLSACVVIGLSAWALYATTRFRKDEGHAMHWRIMVAVVAYMLVLPRVQDYQQALLILPTYFVLSNTQHVPARFAWLGLISISLLSPRWIGILPAIGRFDLVWELITVPLTVMVWAIGVWEIYQRARPAVFGAPVGACLPSDVV